MITKKEDLINTYIENDHGGLRDLYLSECEKFGFLVEGNREDYTLWFVAALDDCKYIQDISTPDLIKNCKKLTLSDLKPEENMKTYKTYQECKIANPECEVAVVARCDEFTPPLGEFIAVFKSDDFSDGYAFADKSKSGSPNISDGYYKICNPADYCMTVKEFLDAGYRFEVGDLYMTSSGGVESVHDEDFCKIMNSKDDDGRDNIRYILRAAALDKKPRTKVEYVKVNVSLFSLREEFGRGELYDKKCDNNYAQVVELTTLAASFKRDSLYRRIETPMTEREAFIEEYVAQRNEFAKQNTTADFCEFLADSGKFKLVN